MANIVYVRRSVLENCMTCVLCNNLLEEATTITECMHSFCRKCIYAKLTEKDANKTCPKCHVRLGVTTIDKLIRPDNNLRDLQLKILPCSSKKASTAKSPIRRKERYLTSLDSSDPHVQTKPTLDRSTAKTSVAPEPVKTRKVYKPRQKRGASSSIQSITPQAVIDVPKVQQKRGTGGIWFKLVPYQDPEGSTSQKQLPKPYLRIKDGTMLVSSIHKYLMAKLDLTSEDQVEICCRENPVPPTLTLNDLFSWWLDTCTPEKVKVTIGSSAEELVMELQYVLN